MRIRDAIRSGPVDEQQQQIEREARSHRIPAAVLDQVEQGSRAGSSAPEPEAPDSTFVEVGEAGGMLAGRVMPCSFAEL